MLINDVIFYASMIRYTTVVMWWYDISVLIHMVLLIVRCDVIVWYAINRGGKQLFSVQPYPPAPSLFPRHVRHPTGFQRLIFAAFLLGVGGATKSRPHHRSWGVRPLLPSPAGSMNGPWTVNGQIIRVNRQRSTVKETATAHRGPAAKKTVNM